MEPRGPRTRPCAISTTNYLTYDTKISLNPRNGGELRRKLELENAITTGSVLNKDALSRAFAELADALSSVVMSDRNLSRESKEDFLRNLSDWPLRLQLLPTSKAGSGTANGQNPKGTGAKAEHRPAIQSHADRTAKVV